MKKIISIPLIFLILFSGITVSYSTHYCGGAVAATKVSISGELAGCGMEEPVNNTDESVFTNHCCDDVTSLYTVSNDYVHSVLYFEKAGNQVIHLFDLPGIRAACSDLFAAVSHIDKRPPGLYAPNSVDREAICIFRI